MVRALRGIANPADLRFLGSLAGAQWQTLPK